MSAALIAFLNARLDEDADEAQDRHEGHCATAGPIYFPCDCGYPARVLRGVEADRKLLREYDLAYRTAEEPGLLLAVKIRAARFSDHPDYDPGWKP